MKFFAPLLASTFLFSGLLSAQETKILFLGNSYTASNNLPQLVHDVAESTGDDITYDSNTPGGYTLEGHAGNATTLDKINSDNWDYVVIQAQSQEPSFPTWQVEANTFPYATELCDQIRANNPCSRPTFYMTWGRENGDQSNCANWPPVCTYEGMDSLLNLRYQMMGDMNSAYVSPVGAVWRYIRENNDEIDLYSGDGSHPSQAGSYAAACTFYAILLEKDPTNITYDFTLNAETADYIKQAAKTVAFDDLENWNIGVFVPEASFDYTVDGTEVTFENTSTNFAQSSWDFGTGETSMETNPTYDFGSASPPFIVTLTVNDCDTTHSVMQEILVTDIDEYRNATQVFFNPKTQSIQIDNAMIDDYTLRVLDQNGRLVREERNATVIAVDDFASGVFICQVLDNKGSVIIAQKVIVH